MRQSKTSQVLIGLDPYAYRQNTNGAERAKTNTILRPGTEKSGQKAKKCVKAMAIRTIFRYSDPNLIRKTDLQMAKPLNPRARSLDVSANDDAKTD